MKKTIRFGVYETNSSSIHSLTILKDDDYHRWMNNEIAVNISTGEIYEKDSKHFNFYSKYYSLDKIYDDYNVYENEEPLFDKNGNTVHALSIYGCE